MAGRASAFAVLGLEPGADGAAVEQAYRRLIKQHHPDREGGNADRAAEIIRAYRELRGGKAASDPLQFNEEFGPRRRPARWPMAAAVAGAAVAGLVLMMGSSVPMSLPISVKDGSSGTRAAASTSSDGMDERLHNDVIDGAVRQALRLYRTKDELALANESKACQQRFRERPGTALLDRCAAFDDAVVGLQDRDPLRDGGPFAPLAVTGRQWSAASTLSDDYLAIDGRLDRIRLRVELALAPQIPPIAPPTPAPAPIDGD